MFSSTVDRRSKATCRPTEVTFSALLSSFNRSEWPRGLRVLETMATARVAATGIQAGAVARHMDAFQAWRLLRRLRRAWRGGAVALRVKPAMVSSEDFVAGEALASRLDREASGVLPVASGAAKHWLQAHWDLGKA